MRSRSLPSLALLLAGPAQEPARLARDPDRGLEPALRAVLVQVDPLRDTWPGERTVARLAPRLAELARAFERDELAALSTADWLDPALSAPALAPAEPRSERGPWRFETLPAGAGERPFLAALAHWRSSFEGPARLELEPFEVAGDEKQPSVRLRVVASGTGAGERRQHESVWRTRWRLEDERGPLLVGLESEGGTAVALRGHPRGLFEDVSVALVGAEAHARELAPGLDHWRRSLPAPLEPGQLGHHGLALGDVDGDGREDLYWCRPGGLPNRLYLHRPDGTVREASAEAGVDLLDYSSSALCADFDLDGHVDLVVATARQLVFFAGDGAAHFERKLVLPRSLATSLAAADVEGDGDLDLYVCSYVSPYEASGTPETYVVAENGEANRLLRNEGDWRFEDATAELGLEENNRRFSLGAAFEDVDDDGDPDLYVANDFGRNNLYLWEEGRFRDVAEERGALDVSAGMGVSFGDADGDGRQDLYVTNLYSSAGSRLTASGARGEDAAVAHLFREHAQGNTLLRNEGARFRDVSVESGTYRGRWGWGGLFVELDGDGVPDLVAPNGFVSNTRTDDLDSFFWRRVVLQSPGRAGEPDEAYQLGWRAVRRLVRQGWSWNGHERDVAYLGLGAGRFRDVSGPSGLDFAGDARALARVDWDADGDEDLFLASRDGPMLRLLANGSAPAPWLAFELDGVARTPIGARVELVCTSGRTLSRSLRCGEGYLAQSSARLLFALGSERVERVRVRWPEGASEDFGAPEPGTLYRLVRGSGAARACASLRSPALAASEPAAVPAPAGTRTVLPEPLPMARLALESTSGESTALFGLTPSGPRGAGQPLLLVVTAVDEPGGSRALAALVAARAQLASAGLGVLALSADVGEARARARADWSALGWSFGAAFASEEALQLLELVVATLHDDALPLPLPSAFLVDARGYLQAVYCGALEPARICADLALVGLAPEARLAACVPFAGRWLAPPPTELAPGLATRLAAHGLERASAEYRLPRIEVRTGGAELQFEAGVARQKEGRYADAIEHYRRALAADPSHARAAQNLAVALHQDGQREAALQAYRAALKLDPAHARTRHNLGQLYLELGDLEGARQELEALRRLGSEFAADLEARIRARSR